MRWFLEAYKGFSRQERSSLLLVLIILVILLFYRIKISSPDPEPLFLTESQKNEIDSLINSFEPVKEKITTLDTKNENTDTKTYYDQLLEFDPNTVSRKELLNMGFEKFVTDNIVKYRKSGGSFKKAEDLAQIYGLDSEDYQKIKPYISIASDSVMTRVEESVTNRDSLTGVEYNRELNSAAFKDLIWINGLDARISGRILNYRDLLGGYYSFEQLNEVYGMTDSVLTIIREKFSIEKDSIMKLVPSKMSFSELLRHPYLEVDDVKKLLKLADYYGDSLKKEDITKNRILPDSVIERIGPYFP